MASELYVETLKGLTSGANANKVIIPSGQTLDASAGEIVPSAGQVVQVVSAENSSNVQVSTGGNSFSALYGFSQQNRLYADLVSVSITPKSASNTLIITMSAGMTSGSMASQSGFGIVVVRDNTTGYQRGDFPWYDASGWWAVSPGAYPPPQNLTISVSAGSTSAQTFYMKGYTYAESGTRTTNFRDSGIYIMEIAG